MESVANPVVADEQELIRSTMEVNCVKAERLDDD